MAHLTEMQLNGADDAPSSEGNYDLARVPEKKTRQRKKTKLSISADEDFERVEPAPKKKAKRRVGKAKLEGFMWMPIDILTEVCLYLRPLDLLHLARTSHRLRDIFMSKGWESAWRAARSTVEGLPDCPIDLAEPQYASLMFEIGCQKCSNKTVRKTDYVLRLRLCKTCASQELITMPSASMLRVLPDFVWSAPLPRTTYHQVKRYQRVCSRTTVERLAQRFKSVNLADDAVIATLGAEFRQECKAIIETGLSMEGFKNDEKIDKSMKNDDLSAARVSQIEDRLFALGWTKGDIPRSWAWHSLTYKPSGLSDQVWNRLYTKLEPLLELEKRNRLLLEKERRRQHRYSDLDQSYDTYMDELEIEEHDLSRRNPLGIVDIARIPSIAALLEADTNGMSADDWAATNDDLKALICSRAQELETHLEGLLAVPPTSSTKWEKLHLDRVGEAEEEWTTHPLPDVNSFFVCNCCNILLWADEVPRHRCFTSFADYAESLRIPLRTPVTRQIIGHLLDALKSDFPNIETLLRSEERNLLCERCDPRIAEPMTFKNLVRHFDGCNWEHVVALCAPLPPVTTTHPARKKCKQLNPHDCSINATLVVLATPTIIEERRQLKAEFGVHSANIQQALSMLEYPWTMFTSTKRRCLLCPDMGDLIQSMEAGPLEIHIKQIHGREARLAEDSQSDASRRGPSAIFDFLPEWASWSDLEDSDDNEDGYFF